MTTKTHHARSRRFDVTLVGDTNLDLILYGIPEALPTEQELLASGMTLRVGGSGAITAHNLAALGNAVGFITAAPNDDFGERCRKELRDAGVDLSSCVSVKDTSCGITVHLQHWHRRHMFTFAGATFELKLEDLDLDYLTNSRHFHMSSYYLQRSLTSQIPDLFARLKGTGLTLSLDPNDDPDRTWDRGILEAIRFVDLLMPNEREACLLSGETDLNRAIAALRQLVPLLVVKQGSKGASAFTRTGEWHVPAQAVEIVDAIGAGDSFNAGFLHAWMRGHTIERALEFGNITGSWSTSSNGGTSAFRDQHIVNALESEWKNGTEILTEPGS
jgi:sugar/nucleoside kinase (ribokinase family)